MREFYARYKIWWWLVPPAVGLIAPWMLIGTARGFPHLLQYFTGYGYGYFGIGLLNAAPFAVFVLLMGMVLRAVEASRFNPLFIGFTTAQAIGLLISGWYQWQIVSSDSSTAVIGYVVLPFLLTIVMLLTFAVGSLACMGYLRWRRRTARITSAN